MLRNSNTLLFLLRSLSFVKYKKTLFPNQSFQLLADYNPCLWSNKFFCEFEKHFFKKYLLTIDFSKHTMNCFKYNLFSRYILVNFENHFYQPASISCWYLGSTLVFNDCHGHTSECQMWSLSLYQRFMACLSA